MSNSFTRILNCFRNKRDMDIGVWFMRQAGRFLPAYRDLRKKFSFVKMCQTPQLIEKVTLLPLEYVDVDALILFSDILTPVWGMGVDLDFVEGKGPVLGDFSDPLEVISSFDMSKLDFLFEGIQLVKGKIKGEKFFFGFSAAPFTFLAYFLEGGHSKNFLNLRSMLYKREKAGELFERITDLLIEYIEMQFSAGVDGVQIFDSWIGFMGRENFKWYISFLKRIVSRFRDKNLIYFPLNSFHILDIISKLDFKVISVDWRVDILEPIKHGFKGGIQGNLDPAVLLTDEDTIKREAEKILSRRNDLGGFIFNTGHGIYPETPYQNVKVLVDFIHGWGK